MKMSGNEIRPGNVILHKNGIWLTVKTQSVKPGKGGAYNQVELKNLIDGTKLNERFRASETVEKAHLEQKDYLFLYEQGEQLIFMDLDSYDQIELDKNFVGERTAFLQNNMTVTLEVHDGKPLSIRLPAQITLLVAETSPMIKKQTASASYKPAVLANGIRILIPPFIETGEHIVVDTNEITYVRRADRNT